MGNVIYRGSNTNGDGRVYPDTAEVRTDENIFETPCYTVFDVTGWNGFEVCGDQWVATFGNQLDAIEYVKLHYETWSDPQKVIRAAVNMLNKSAGAFTQLKAAVDWRDRC